MAESYLETSFALMLKHHGIGGYVTQYRFAPPRLWRFDFAWRCEFVAVEIEGVGRADGGESGHRTREGFLKDAEKHEAALVQGWRLYRVPGPWIATAARHVWRPEVIDTLQALLGLRRIDTVNPHRASDG